MLTYHGGVARGHKGLVLVELLHRLGVQLRHQDLERLVRLHRRLREREWASALGTQSEAGAAAARIEASQQRRSKCKNGQEQQCTHDAQHAPISEGTNATSERQHGTNLDRRRLVGDVEEPVVAVGLAELVARAVEALVQELALRGSTHREKVGKNMMNGLGVERGTCPGLTGAAMSSHTKKADDRARI